MSKVSQIRINFVRRNAVYSGPSDSKQINDSWKEISTDLVNLSNQWNNRLVPLCSTIPSGSSSDGSTTPLDAFTNGLDGSTLYVEADATLSSDSKFYNSGQSRPNSVKEQFSAVYLYADTINDSLRDEIAEMSSALTEAQKARIGYNIFDSSQSSSSSSLDGMTQLNQDNLLQVAKDLYDTTHVNLDGSGSAALTYSIRDHLQALLSSHNGSFDTDLTLDHAGQVNASDLVGQVAQSGVAASVVYNDSYSGSPANVQDDLNQIRSMVKTLLGTASWQTQPLDWDANSITVQDIADWTGTGTRDSDNPFGMHIVDIDGDYTDIVGLSGVLDNIVAFTGMDNVSDSTPSYTSTVYVSDGDSLEASVGAIDGALNSHASNTSNPHSVTLTQAASAGGVVPASQVTILDSGNLFIGAEVESALEEVMSDLDSLEISFSTISGNLDSHTVNYGNPHNVIASQIGASGILEELNANGSVKLSSTLMASGVMFSSDVQDLLNDHIEGGLSLTPSGQHWASDIDCTDTLEVSSFVSGDLTLDNVLYYMAVGDDFRRQDISFESWANAGVLNIEHNKGLYPIVQVLDMDGTYPVVIDSDIEIAHSGLNRVLITNNTGSTVTSGLAILQW
ncbi:hypothetical protein GF373_17430 [bacterium]|nr:hypothetical protein [bacterium]